MARRQDLRSLLTPQRIAIGVLTFLTSAAAGAYEVLRGQEAPSIGCLSNAEIDRLPGEPEQEQRRAA